MAIVVIGAPVPSQELMLALLLGLANSIPQELLSRAGQAMHALVARCDVCVPARSLGPSFSEGVARRAFSGLVRLS